MPCTPSRDSLTLCSYGTQRGQEEQGTVMPSLVSAHGPCWMVACALSALRVLRKAVLWAPHLLAGARESRACWLLSVFMKPCGSSETFWGSPPQPPLPATLGQFEAALETMPEHLSPQQSFYFQAIGFDLFVAVGHRSMSPRQPLFRA